MILAILNYLASLENTKLTPISDSGFLKLAKKSISKISNKPLVFFTLLKTLEPKTFPKTHPFKLLTRSSKKKGKRCKTAVVEQATSRDSKRPQHSIHAAGSCSVHYFPGGWRFWNYQHDFPSRRQRYFTALAENRFDPVRDTRLSKKEGERGSSTDKFGIICPTNADCTRLDSFLKYTL